MQQPLHIDFKPQEEISDTLSTSAPSVNYNPFEENSPHADSTTSMEHDGPVQSKKIRKKRDAYKKIDDEIRLGLLEAVQRGETLKSAAKRYQVNYSSAKSIFHIYRKEGRILKKATQDKDFGMIPMASEEPAPAMPPQFIPIGNPNPNMMNIPIGPFYQKSIFAQQPFYPQEQRQDRMARNQNDGSGCSSPLNGLVDNFSELLKIGGDIKAKETMRPNNYMPINPSQFLPRMVSPTNQMARMMSPTNQVLNRMQPNQQMAMASANVAMVSPKQFDNFYMNYSNSPLSGNAKMMRKGSESGSNRYVKGEFDSFSEMVSAFQNQNHLAESLNNLPMSKKLVGEEELPWNGNIENAALDTYKSFIDAQVTLSNAFMKASYLNNLVQIQKSKMDASPSPKFLNFKGN